MKLTEQQLNELAAELHDRTQDFLSEETWQLLFDNEVITETDNDAIVLINKLLLKFYHPNLTKVTFDK
jgi:transcriptional regulator CtsR